jgi:hypothetical protein
MRSRHPSGLVIRRAVRRDRLEGGETGRQVAAFRERHGAADLRADRRREAHETLVEQRDFPPVNRAADAALRVDGLDGGLELIAAGVFESGRRAQMCLRLVDRRPRPKRHVLPVERHEVSFAATVARGAARFAMQDEREQAVRLGFVGQELDERATEMRVGGRELSAADDDFRP